MVIPCFSTEDANRKIDVPNEPTDDEPRFEGLLINLKWTDTGMDRRVLTRKLIVCPMGRGYVPSLMIGISCAHMPIYYILSRIYIFEREGERGKINEGERGPEQERRKEGMRCKEDRENDLHLPLLNFKLSQLFPSNPLVVVLSSQKPATLPHPPPSAAPSHPFLYFPLSLSLSLSLANAPKAPLNLAHRTNGLLYASAYTRTIPFYPEIPGLSFAEISTFGSINRGPLPPPSPHAPLLSLS